MSKELCAPPNQWEAFDHRGRRFLKFDLRVQGDRWIPFTIAQQIAGRYEILDVLARGGGGVILVARDLRTENRVLVKALAEYDTKRHDLDMPLDDFVESIRRSRHHLQTERRLLVQLRNGGCNAVPHPNDYVFDINPGLAGPHQTQYGDQWHFDDDELVSSEPYLVLQHINGMSLKDVLEKYYRNGLEEAVALRIIDQVARVIELLQQPLHLANGQRWNLVYQDLKPSNVLVDEYGHATVLDYGGCQLVINETLVLHGSHSPGHCAPECGRSDGPITHAADTYTLGSTLFHMLSGEDPRRMLPKERPPEASPAVRIDAGRLAKKCTPEVIKLISRAVNWEAAERFPTASDFRAELSPLLSWT